MTENGKLIGIARAPIRGGRLETINVAGISIERGLEGDARGIKPRRQVSILFREDWQAACRDVEGLNGALLAWTVRRANLLVEGFANPRLLGARLGIGEVELEIVCETDPCDLMERAQSGLKAALKPDWRGGVCCKVISGGTIRLGDLVSFA